MDLGVMILCIHKIFYRFQINIVLKCNLLIMSFNLTKDNTGDQKTCFDYMGEVRVEKGLFSP